MNALTFATIAPGGKVKMRASFDAASGMSMESIKRIVSCESSSDDEAVPISKAFKNAACARFTTCDMHLGGHEPS